MKSLKDLFVLALIAVVCLVLASLASTPAILFLGMDKPLGIIIVQWLSCIGMFFIPALVWCKWYKKENPFTAFKFTKPSNNALLLAVVFALVSVPFGSSTAQWIELLPFPQAIRDYVDGQLVMQIKSIYLLMGNGSHNPLYFINGIILIGVATGIVEETMFRGAVRKCISDYAGVHTTAIVVGLIFSLIHFEFYGFIWRWFLGSFYVYLVYYSGSIWTSIIAHAINNSVAVVMMFFDDSMEVIPVTDAEWLAAAKAQDAELPAWIVGISTILTILVLVYFWQNRAKFKNNSPEIAAE